MNTQIIDYAQMVRDLAKPGAEIAAYLSPSNAHLLHMAVGVSGEAGELLDAVKKAAIYNKALDRANVIEELGDLEFYMQGLRDELGISREEVLTANVAKLSKRYAAGKYSDKAAQTRADKTVQTLESVKPVERVRNFFGRCYEAFQVTAASRQDNKDWPEWMNEAWNTERNLMGALYPADFPDSDGTDTLIVNPPHRTPVNFGDWLVADSQGIIGVYSPELFSATFKKV